MVIISNLSKDEKENPRESIGYVKVPEAHEVIAKMRRCKRAPEPSPLLQEYLKREAEKDDGKR